jgi:hypothetical protein
MVQPGQHDAPPLCSNCAEIDWASIIAHRDLSRSRESGPRGFVDSFPWHESWMADEGSQCPFCALMSSLVVTSSKESRGFSIVLAGYVLLHSEQYPMSAPVLASHSGKLISPMLGLLHSQSASDEFAPRLIDAGSIDYSVLQTWLRQCESDHSKACLPTRSARFLAFRVLDCKSRKIVQADPECSYVALSYVWGQLQDTTNAEFPQTIEDAFTVSLQLGFNFLCE